MRNNNCEVIPIIVEHESSLKSVNFYLFQKGKSLVLIDAGYNTDQCWNALVETLQRRGLAVHDLTAILLTHHHIDHIGLVNRIIRLNPVPVYAHPLSIPRLKRDETFLNMRIAFFSELYKEMGCGEQGEKQASYLRESMEKNRYNKINSEITSIEENIMLDFEVIHVPGHAPDQVAFYDKDCKWLFAGDLLIEHISSNALVEPDESGRRMMTLKDHYQSIKKGSELHADLVFSGHGKIIDDPERVFWMRLQGIERKGQRFLDLIAGGVPIAADIAQTYYKDTYLKQFSLVMSEVIGHLDYLEYQGKIQKTLIDGIWHYFPVKDTN